MFRMDAESGMGFPRVLFWIGVFGIGMSGGGCNNAQPSVDLDKAITQYQSRQYHASYAIARDLEKSSTGAAKKDAAYLAGVSARRLGRDAEAIRYLEGVASHSDKLTAGAANAELGMIYAKRKQHRRAKSYFERAVKMLENEDQAEALFRLGLSERALNEDTAARAHMSLAVSRSKSASFKRKVRTHLAATGYTLQLGSFTRLRNAEAMVKRVQSTALRAGVGYPRVVEGKTSSGKTIYRVRVGAFSTHDSALKSRTRLGRRDAIVTRMTGS